MGQNKIYKKKFTELTVYDAALERLRDIYDRYDRVIVSFSGGKDSTVVLQLALIVAKERNRLPLEVFTIDEEAIHPPTVDYLQRVADNPDVKFTWFCLPIKHRNACSRKQPWWICWNPEEKHLWTREMPESAVTHLDGFKLGMGAIEACNLIGADFAGSVCQLIGLRAQESIRRYRVVASKKHDNYMSLSGGMKVHRGYPIYDWMVEDVWVAPQKYGWDYNETYDIFERAGMGINKQRVCPPYGEEPLRGLWVYAQCFPEMWHKMLARVKGVATAWRYANTELYLGDNKPDSVPTYKEYMKFVIEMYPPDEQSQLYDTANRMIVQHNKKSKLDIQDETPDPISGISYKFICKCLLKGDFKGRTAQSATTKLNFKDGYEFANTVDEHGTDYMKQKQKK